MHNYDNLDQGSHTSSPLVNFQGHLTDHTCIFQLQDVAQLGVKEFFDLKNFLSLT